MGRWAQAQRRGSVSPGSTVVPEVLALLTNLVSYWKLDENVTGSPGGNRADSVGANTMVDTALNCGSTASPAIFNRSVTFGSPTCRLRAVDAAGFSGGSSFSVQIWMYKTTSQVNVPYICKYATGKEWLVFQLTTGGTIQFWQRKLDDSGSIVADSGVVPASLAWYHICCGFDAVNGLIWIQVNGGARQTTAYAGACRDTTDPVAIGGYGDATPASHDGSLDESAYWNRVLTTAEVAALYNSGAGLPLSSFT